MLIDATNAFAGSKEDKAVFAAKAARNGQRFTEYVRKKGPEFLFSTLSKTYNQTVKTAPAEHREDQASLFDASLRAFSQSQAESRLFLQSLSHRQYEEFISWTQPGKSRNSALTFGAMVARDLDQLTDRLLFFASERQAVAKEHAKASNLELDRSAWRKVWRMMVQEFKIIVETYAHLTGTSLTPAQVYDHAVRYYATQIGEHLDSDQANTRVAMALGLLSEEDRAQYKKTMTWVATSNETRQQIQIAYARFAPDPKRRREQILRSRTKMKFLDRCASFLRRLTK